MRLLISCWPGRCRNYVPTMTSTCTAAFVTIMNREAMRGPATAWPRASALRRPSSLQGAESEQSCRRVLSSSGAPPSGHSQWRRRGAPVGWVWRRAGRSRLPAAGAAGPAPAWPPLSRLRERSRAAPAPGSRSLPLRMESSSALVASISGSACPTGVAGGLADYAKVAIASRRGRRSIRLRRGQRSVLAANWPSG